MKLKSICLINEELKNNKSLGESFKDKIDANQMLRIKKEYNKFISITEECSSHILEYSSEIKFIDSNLMIFEKTPNGNKHDIYLDPNNHGNIIKKYDLNNYDTIFIITPWNTDGMERFFHLSGRGGFYINHCISWIPSWIEGFGINREPGEAFIHEWLHGINGFLFDKGLDTTINPDNSNYFGYSTAPWLQYYKAIMTSTLINNSKSGIGISINMWEEYASRHFQKRD